MIINMNVPIIYVTDEDVNYSEKTYQFFFYVYIGVKNTLKVGWVTGIGRCSCAQHLNII